MPQRAYRYRIYPTAEQDETLRQFAGTARFIYNLALEQRRDYWRQFRATMGRRISWASQSREVTQLRADVDWLKAVPRSLCESALKDLDSAFENFFAMRSGYPAMRARGHSDGFRIQGRDCPITVLNRKWALVHFPKCGLVKLRLTRPMPEGIKSVSVRLVADTWYASCAGDHADASAVAMADCAGIDRGVANTFSLSTGEHYQMPAHVAASIEKRKRAQRILSRRKKGSARRTRQRTVVAKHHAHAAAARTHWLHERSTDIAQRFGLVALEKLKVVNMTASGTGKRGLNRSILEQGWSIFAAMLEYKLAERGGHVEYINPAYTSQSCSECGSVNRESRKSQAVFHCVDCGHAAHADTNAAINILR